MNYSSFLPFPLQLKLCKGISMHSKNHYHQSYLLKLTCSTWLTLHPPHNALTIFNNSIHMNLSCMGAWYPSCLNKLGSFPPNSMPSPWACITPWTIIEHLHQISSYVASWASNFIPHVSPATQWPRPPTYSMYARMPPLHIFFISSCLFQKVRSCF